MKFGRDISAFEAASLDEIRESLERCDRCGLSPFRTLVAVEVEVERTYPDTAVVVTYRYEAQYKPMPEDLRACFEIWAK